MSKHTPGPWHVGGNVYGTSQYAVLTDMSVIVAEVVEWYDEKSTNANAHLIASTPDLLTALEEMIALAAPNIYPQPDKPGSGWSILQRARAAIAKANSHDRR